MKIEEIYTLIEEFGKIKRVVGRVKMDLAVDWHRMAAADLDEITNHLNMIQKRLILEKTLETLTEPIVEL